VLEKNTKQKQSLELSPKNWANQRTGPKTTKISSSRKDISRLIHRFGGFVLGCEKIPEIAAGPKESYLGAL
jgi:hypothetical protein